MSRRRLGAWVLAAGAVAVAVFSLSPLLGRHPLASCSAAPVPGAPELDHPMGITWSDGFLYVADAGNGAVKKLRPDGSLAAEWTGFERPVAIAVAADGTILVADFLADAVVELDTAGIEVRRWGGSGTGDGQFDAPAGITIGLGGDVYVSDFYNHRVQRFRRDGSFVMAWGERGVRPGRFRFPAGLTVDGSGRILVADAFNHRVQVFAPDGRREDGHGAPLWGLGGSRRGWFRVAKEVAVDSAGAIWVADAFNGRVQKLDPGGSVLAVWDAGDDPAAPVRYPAGVSADGGGVFVTDFFGSGVSRVRCP